MKKGLLLAIFFLIICCVAVSALTQGQRYYFSGVRTTSPAWNPQYGKVYDTVEAGKPYTLDVKAENIAITKIIFTINRTVSNGGITVYHLLISPSSLPAVPENDSYEFNEIKYTGFVPFDANRFVYYFKVSKGWLQNMTVSRDTVALHVFDKDAGSWVTLPTKITGEDDSFVFYVSDGPAVHYLFIGKAQSGEKAAIAEDNKKVAAQVQEDSAAKELSEQKPSEPVKSEDIAQVSAVDLNKPVAPPPAPTPVAVPAPPAQNGSLIMGAMLLISIGVAALIIYLVFSKKGMGYSVDKELNNYISESLKRGKTKSEVRNRLLDVGWHHERVDKALAKHKDAVKHAEPAKK